MKIFKTTPEESTQWQSDSTSVKAMRIILPIAAVLSAISLAGGLSSFLELSFTNNLHLVLGVLFIVGAFFFDGLGITSGRSVVRDLILSARGEMVRGILFWINVILAATIAGAVVVASFNASRNGIKYLVIEAKKAKEIRTQTDTTLANTIAGAEDQNSTILAAKEAAYNAQRDAINAKWSGKIEAANIEAARLKKQRTTDNFQYIDKLVARQKKQAAQHKANQGAELADLAAAFAEEQARILASSESLQVVTIEDAKDASKRRKQKQEEKDAADKQLSNLVSGIFSWAVVLMLVIGLRLELLEVRNNILPNPILSNTDLSGLEDVRRFVMALPYFLFSWVHYGAEQLYHYAAKRQPPIVDNDLVNYAGAQVETEVIRKEGKIRTLPKRAAARRAIGYNQTGINNSADTHDPTHENSRAIKDTRKQAYETADLRELKQRLKDYKKRVGQHTQKKLKAEREGKKVSKRTLNAIENNQKWVEHYETQIQDLESKLNLIN